MRSTRPVLWIALLFSVVLAHAALSSCASAETKKERHYKKGLEYAAREKYPEAVVEFKNVIQLDPRHADAKYQIGLAYFKMGGLANLRSAFKELNEAVELKPDLIDAHVKIGTLYLASNDLKKAKEKAEGVLQKEPNNVEALLIQARVYQKENRPGDAEKIYQRILEIEPKRLPTYYEFAGLYLFKKNLPAAEALLQKALSLEPGSTDAHLALAKFYQSTREGKKAEEFYQKALSLSPKNKSLYFMLAEFYLRENRIPEAEAKLTEATELDPKDPDPFLALGDFYHGRKRRDDAEKAFLKARGVRPDNLLSQKKLAELYLNEGANEAAASMVSEIHSRNANDLDGMLLKGRLLLVEKKEGEAIESLKKVVQAEPSYPFVHYYLGVAFLLQNDGQQAKSEFTEAVRQNRRDIRSRTALADLHFRFRSFDLAFSEADQAVQADPTNLRANLILGDVAVAKGEIKKAEKVYQKIMEFAPGEPAGYFRMGMLRRGQKKDPEAIPLLEKALALNPNLIEALSQLVSIDLSKGNSEKALRRMTAQIEATPGNPAPYHLLGRFYAVRGEIKQAEENYKKAIDVDPNYLASYLDLGNLYARDKQFDQALQKLDEAIKVKPDVVQFYMLKGVIYDTGKQFDKAQKEYEKALEIDPDFAPAANNLAWLYAEKGGNIDRALTLAQKAKERYPDDPAVSDTLGWIYYKKNAYIKAISLLKESAQKLSENPVVRYHLGMAYAKNGDKGLAKKELTEALRLGKEFEGSSEAEKTLKAL